MKVTSNELRIFFALVLLMSIIKKPPIKLYFSLFATSFFNNLMARNRFLDISQYLYFSDAGYKKFEKVKLVSDFSFNSKIQIFVHTEKEYINC